MVLPGERERVAVVGFGGGVIAEAGEDVAELGVGAHDVGVVRRAGLHGVAPLLLEVLAGDGEVAAGHGEASAHEVEDDELG